MCWEEPDGVMGSLGDLIVVSVREAIPKASVKKGDVMKAVIVRTQKRLSKGGWLPYKV